jgi:hypothetical protein
MMDRTPSTTPVYQNTEYEPLKDEPLKDEPLKDTYYPTLEDALRHANSSGKTVEIRRIDISGTVDPVLACRLLNHQSFISKSTPVCAWPGRKQ